MKPLTLAIIIILLIPIISLSTIYLYNKNTVENVVDVPVYVKVDEVFGLNADPGAFNFGKLQPESRGERPFELVNNGTYPLKVTIETHGQIKDWLRFSDNNIELQPSQTVEVVAKMETPNVPYGNYSGFARVIFRKPLFS